MKCTFIVETNKPDSNGDIINFEGLAIKDKTPILRAFNNAQVLGQASLKVEGEYLIAEAEILDRFENEILDTYPAIGFKILQEHKEGSNRIIDNAKVLAVGLSPQPNVNPDIKTIRDQCYGKS